MKLFLECAFDYTSEHFLGHAFSEPIFRDDEIDLVLVVHDIERTRHKIDLA